MEDLWGEPSDAEVYEFILNHYNELNFGTAQEFEIVINLIWDILIKEKYAGWKMIAVDKKERQAFLEKRQKYLLY